MDDVIPAGSSTWNVVTALWLFYRRRASWSRPGASHVVANDDGGGDAAICTKNTTEGMLTVVQRRLSRRTIHEDLVSSRMPQLTACSDQSSASDVTQWSVDDEPLQG
ncbi:hypothetical protein HBI81_004860 [Parastagonospora nodorum]|nr:hypothetical protein HBH50_148220 [Parastagonospora nodorum]KAH4089448.1 hypothetical protein HBH48_113320 [Parastagonospora nodorum]KAH5293774.1 hypothetical protein HBI11_182010 [Parastagonospora nodorum]KAH5474049.1 hypothetical protein HBI28_115550 [Parastagonospora nodorum]KAH5632959.1 hypothetical protein HBI22_105070 [Parastagonospora nodorum]